MVRAAEAIASRASSTGKRSRLMLTAMSLVPPLFPSLLVAQIGRLAGLLDCADPSPLARRSSTLVPCDAPEQRLQSVEKCGFSKWPLGFSPFVSAALTRQSIPRLFSLLGAHGMDARI